MMHVNYFIGPTYYQRLTHQVSDKYQSRDDGLKTALTHQPVGGRSLGGGGIGTAGQESGVANTGSGGVGFSYNGGATTYPSGAGGSGIVIVRYAK
jgi:hypothetical protein